MAPWLCLRTDPRSTCIVACYRYKTIFGITAPKDVTCKYLYLAPANPDKWLISPGDAVDNTVWSIIETNVTVICVCIITIKPIIHLSLNSSFILKTRKVWKRLLSSRSRVTSYGRETSSPTPLVSIPNRQEGLLQATPPNKRVKQDMETIDYGRKVPLQCVRIDHSSNALGDDAV